MKKQDSLTASQEDYLEAIFHIASEKQAARAKDIARRLKVKAASVTGALRVLGEKGLINYAPYDVITLTSDGAVIAEDVVRRHEVFRDFFIRVLGVDPIEAEESACEMEHAVPRSVLDKLIQFVEFLDLCPRAGADWMEAFKDYCKGGIMQDNCVSCTFRSLETLKGKRSKDVEEGKTLLPLHELEPGQKAKIIKIKGRGEVHDQIISLGFKPGAVVEIEQGTYKGGHVGVMVKGYHRSLRKDDADKVIIELI